VDRQDILAVVRKLLAAQGQCTNRDVANATGLSRQAVHQHLRRLAQEGLVDPVGQGRATHYLPGAAWEAPSPAPSTHAFPTAGLEETLVWDRLVETHEALRQLPRNVEDILHYSVTELVNNAIDHSDADEVVVAVVTREDRIEVTVRDRGHGVFRRVMEGLGLPTALEALQELSKGKVTTQPERHTGEGIFFVSKAVDEFSLEGGGLRWCVDNTREDMAVGSSAVTEGTRAWLSIGTTSKRSLREVFDRYTEDYEFTRTSTVIRLFAVGVKFVSRSEARRLVHGLDRFREVILDFRGVELVGQGFLDEVFRVWARAHPETRLRPVNMTEPVEFMVRRSLTRAAQGA
jgi:anti-sigma regulatory factor (Ser/Thr protein kinase)/biotin operon repressor